MRSDKVSVEKIRVVFVCLGNICRSPMAEGVFAHLVEEAGLSDRFEISSAGTGGYHVGERPHKGTQAVLKEHGIRYDGRAQQLAAEDVAGDGSWIIVMDSSNFQDVERRFGRRPRLKKLLDFAHNFPNERDVPDPYYVGGFDVVFDLVQDGCQGLLAEIRRVEQV